MNGVHMFNATKRACDRVFVLASRSNGPFSAKNRGFQVLTVENDPNNYLIDRAITSTGLSSAFTGE